MKRSRDGLKDHPDTHTTMENNFDYDWIDLPTGLAETLMAFGDGREAANTKANKIDTVSYAAAREAGRLPYESLESHRLGCLTEGAFALAMGVDPLSLEYVVADRYSKVNDADLLIDGTYYEVRNSTKYGSGGVCIKPKDVRVNAQVISVYAEADPDGKNATGRVFFKGFRNAREGWEAWGTMWTANGRERVAVARPMPFLEAWKTANVNRVWGALR